MNWVVVIAKSFGTPPGISCLLSLTGCCNGHLPTK